MKICKACGKSLPLSEYHTYDRLNKRNGKTYFQVFSRCKKCYSKQQGRPERYEGRLDYYAEQRKHFLGLLGDKCVACGTTENLEFDHKDPATKSFTLAGSWSRKYDTLYEEVMKCQLLCTDCHKEKTKREKDNMKGKQRNDTTTPHLKRKYD